MVVVSFSHSIASLEKQWYVLPKYISVLCVLLLVLKRTIYARKYLRLFKVVAFMNVVLSALCWILNLKEALDKFFMSLSNDETIQSAL